MNLKSFMKLRINHTCGDHTAYIICPILQRSIPKALLIKLLFHADNYWCHEHNFASSQVRESCKSVASGLAPTTCHAGRFQLSIGKAALNAKKAFLISGYIEPFYFLPAEL